MVEAPIQPFILGVERLTHCEFEAQMPPASVTNLSIHLAGRCTLEWAIGARPMIGRPARGQMTIVPQGRSGYLRVHGGPTELLKIGIPDMAFASWAEADERLWRPDMLLDRFAAYDPLVRQLGLTLMTEMERRGTVDTLYRDALANALMAHLVNRHSRGEQSADAVSSRRVHPLSEPRSRAVVAIMEAQLTRAIGLEEIARELGLSTSHFSAQFRTRFGCSPARYLTWLRLERARAMLETGSAPITEIARQVGFTNASHFSQAYRQEFGETPSIWRRRQR